MKKNGFILLMLAAFCTAFVACSKDDASIPQGPPQLLTTLVNTDITEITVCGSLLPESGGGIREWGVCWGTEPAPATDGDKVTAPVEGSTFRVVLPDLDPMRVYYVRCYAVNDEGTAYGNELSFLSGDMELTAREIPDTAFRRVLLRACDLDGDGRLMASEAAMMTTLSFRNDDIVSLEGIRYLYDLRQLTIAGEKIREIRDVPHMTTLRCLASQTSLRISECPALEEVEFSSNGWLDSLYIGRCPELKLINCHGNKLSILDIVDLPGLKELVCSLNRLSALDLSGCPALEDLNCYDNPLPALDISALVGLRDLDCCANLLSALDLSGCPMLRALYCDNNKLAKLDISTQASLRTLSCRDNLLSTLDLSGCPTLRYLHCDNNQLAMLDTEALPDLRELHCSNNLFAALNVSRCPKLGELDCNDNKLPILDVSANPKLYHLFCAGNLLATLDVSKCPELEEVDCDRNTPLATVLVSPEQAALQDARGDIPGWAKPGTAVYSVAP